MNYSANTSTQNWLVIAGVCMIDLQQLQGIRPTGSHTEAVFKGGAKVVYPVLYEQFEDRLLKALKSLR